MAPSSVLCGGLFAVERSWFLHLGGYDPELQIYGGEEMELGFSAWQCGGSVVHEPCLGLWMLWTHSGGHSRGLKRKNFSSEFQWRLRSWSLTALPSALLGRQSSGRKAWQSSTSFERRGSSQIASPTVLHSALVGRLWPGKQPSICRLNIRE